MGKCPVCGHDPNVNALPPHWSTPSQWPELMARQVEAQRAKLREDVVKVLLADPRQLFSRAEVIALLESIG